MAPGSYYDRNLGVKSAGRGAHSTASMITMIYASLRFFDSGETSSSGSALGLLELITRISNAMSQ